MEENMKHLIPLISIFVGLLATPAVGADDEIGQVEEIYVVRSLRFAREKPTSNCAEERTGFPNVLGEDRFTLQSLKLDPATGKVSDSNVATVGNLIGCIGRTSDPANFNFYVEGALGDVKFNGKGECLPARKDFPEAGLNMIRCFVDLANLPQQYIGGHLTSNTINSRRMVGLASDPPGYVQPSIATIRLWKARARNQE